MMRNSGACSADLVAEWKARQPGPSFGKSSSTIEQPTTVERASKASESSAERSGVSSYLRGRREKAEGR